ncbi:MAG TPA: hypothetical protein VHW09_01925 [Bryobacteraceae bacterium]|jgi:hypothetical protein|nr:hypothetical protein [Bryobacteraceae bacterium]
MPTVEVPADPNEPVTGVVQTLTTPEDRGHAMQLLSRARLRLQLHAPRTPAFQISASFSSNRGSGAMTETWMNGQKWRWEGNVDKETAVRIPADGLHYALPMGGAIPPAIHLLRGAIFWAAHGLPDAQGSARSTTIDWNGRPATCLLFGPRNTDPSGPRSWDEEEYCIDDATGVLQEHSEVPGTYVNYTYAAAPYHGRSVPSGIVVMMGNKKVLDAQVTIADAGAPDESLFVPTEQMRSYGPVGTSTSAGRTMFFEPSASVSDRAKPVIVRASINGEGTVVSEDLSIASDLSLAQTALDVVKAKSFPPNGNTRELFVEVRFVNAGGAMPRY